VKISLLVIRCQDIEASRLFYQRFGLTFQKEKHNSGPEHYSCEYEGVVFELYPNNGDAPKDNTRLGFNVADVDVATRDLEAATYEFEGQTVWVVRDPDGRKIELSAM
jgi:catechol 2,3-dioxygenase-like lactoylglutathione lyase family enzyme